MKFRGRVSCYCLFGGYNLDAVSSAMGEATETQEKRTRSAARPLFDFRGYTHDYNAGMYVHSFANVNVTSVIGKSVKAQVLARGHQVRGGGEVKRQKGKNADNPKDYGLSRGAATKSDYHEGGGFHPGAVLGRGDAAALCSRVPQEMSLLKLNSPLGGPAAALETDSLLGGGGSVDAVGFGSGFGMYPDRAAASPAGVKLEGSDGKAGGVTLGGTLGSSGFPGTRTVRGTVDAVAESGASITSAASTADDEEGGPLPSATVAPPAVPAVPTGVAVPTVVAAPASLPTAMPKSPSVMPQVYHDFNQAQEQQKKLLTDAGGAMAPPAVPLPSQDPPTFEGNPDAFVPTRNIFIFPSGCVVFWNYPKKAEHAFLKFIDWVGDEKVTEEESDRAFDELSYNYDIPKAPLPAVGRTGALGRVSDTSTTVFSPKPAGATAAGTAVPNPIATIGETKPNNFIPLPPPQNPSHDQLRHPKTPPVHNANANANANAKPPPVSFKARHDHLTIPSQDVLLKTSLSYALAQSSTLFIFEHRISQTIDSTRHIPLTMVETGSLGLSQEDVRRLVGRVYLERFNLNLHSDPSSSGTTTSTRLCTRASRPTSTSRRG